jgi:hypothetical protein
MRGRLTLEKLNSAIDEMATFALANARLLAAPRKKVGSVQHPVLDLRATCCGNPESSFEKEAVAPMVALFTV